MTYQKPKNIVEDVAALYANIVESQTEKVEQLNEDLIGDLIANRGNIKRGATTAIQSANRNASAANRSLSQATTQTANQIKSGVNQTARNVARGYQYGGALGAAGVLGTSVASGIMGSRPTAPAAKPAPSTPATKPAPSTPATKPAPSAQGSQYNMKNLGAAQYAAFKGGGGDAAIKQGYSAGEVVARGRAAINRASGNQPAPATKPVPTGGATRPPVGGTPTSAKPAPTTTSTTTPTAGTTPTTPVTPQRSFNPLMQRTFGYQTGNAPDQIAAASKAVPQATSDAAFKKSAQMVKNIKPSANLNMELDLFDVIKGHLLDEGYAETEDAAIAIMANMGEQWKQSIVEGESGRWDAGGGRTRGPIGGAIHALFSGNLPKGQVYVPPTKQTGPNRPPAVPASKDDSGKLTDFGAGGGKKKMQSSGMTVGQVERQGRMNKGDYSG